MGIGGIKSADSMSVMQMARTNLKDHKSKSIQNEITHVQQQMQKLSSEEGLSANEKANERKKLQKEKASLDTELKQHQDELLRSQKREIRLANLQEDQQPVKDEKTKDRTSSKEISSGTEDKKNLPAHRQQAAQPGTVIAQNDDGTVILKEAIRQDKSSGTNAEAKLADEAKEEAIAKKGAKTADDDTAADTSLSDQKFHAMVSADSSMKLAEHQGTVISRSKDGIAILKSEIKLDEERGTDTERKRAELEKMQKQNQRETAFQSALIGEANNAMKSASETNTPAMANGQDNGQINIQVSGLNVPPEEQALQGLQVSVA